MVEQGKQKIHGSVYTQGLQMLQFAWHYVLKSVIYIVSDFIIKLGSIIPKRLDAYRRCNNNCLPNFKAINTSMNIDGVCAKYSQEPHV